MVKLNFWPFNRKNKAPPASGGFTGPGTIERPGEVMGRVSPPRTIISPPTSSIPSSMRRPDAPETRQGMPPRVHALDRRVPRYDDDDLSISNPLNPMSPFSPLNPMNMDSEDRSETGHNSGHGSGHSSGHHHDSGSSHSSSDHGSSSDSSSSSSDSSSSSSSSD